jgi:hypothetical protein
MQFTFKAAVKSQSKLRLAIFGPSGSGKTFSALRIATGMGGTIALIDTERGSASKYADRFKFSVLELPRKDIATYCGAIEAAQQAGFPILIIDSLSHAWQDLLDEIDKLARTRHQGNTWAAWSEGTPKQRRLVDALLNFDGHIIATMRSKTEWTTEQDSRGKTRPVRVGLAPEQGKGIEYEFDLLMELSVDHIGNIIKDRTGKYQDALLDKPNEAFGRDLVTWLTDGAPAVERPTDQPAQAQRDNAPSDNGETKKGVRPYAPETVKAGLESRAQKGSGVAPTKGLLGAMNGALEMLFGDKPAEQRPVLRRQLLSWWPGVNSSSGLTDGQVRAYLAWAQDQTADGAYVPNDYAIQEAAKIIEALEQEQGQQRLV